MPVFLFLPFFCSFCSPIPVRLFLSLLPVLQCLDDSNCFPKTYGETIWEAGVCIPIQNQLPRTTLSHTSGNYSDRCTLFDNMCNSHGNLSVNWLETTSRHTSGSIFCITYCSFYNNLIKCKCCFFNRKITVKDTRQLKMFTFLH